MLSFEDRAHLPELVDEFMKNKLVKYTKEQIAEFKSFEYMDQDLWTQDTTFKRLTEKVGCDILGWKRRTKSGKTDQKTKPKFDQLRILLLNLKILNKSYLAVSMNNKFYVDRPARYKSKITKTIISIVKEMASACLIDLYMGTKDINTGLGFTTKLKPTSELLNILNSSSLSNIIDTTEEVIILKDRSSGEMRASGEGGKYEFHRKSGKIIDYTDTKATKIMRHEVRAYNKFLSQHDITLPGHEPLIKSVYRVFNDSSFEHGGRYVGGFWQNCKKELRPFITIDGQPTVEIDFTGSHVLIMYALAGVPLVHDPYEQINGTSDRSQAKKICQLLLGCKKRDSIVKSLKNLGISESALDAFLKRHHAISDWFFKKEATRLQRIEVKIISQIHRLAISSDVPVLTIHDSVICKATDRERMQTMMLKVFQAVLKTNNRPLMKVKSHKHN